MAVSNNDMKARDRQDDVPSFTGGAQGEYQQNRQRHWNEIARKLEFWTGWGEYYHQRLIQVYQSIVSPGQSIIELGCARGDLLAALEPRLGVGIDFSEESIFQKR